MPSCLFYCGLLKYQYTWSRRFVRKMKSVERLMTRLRHGFAGEDERSERERERDSSSPIFSKQVLRIDKNIKVSGQWTVPCLVHSTTCTIELSFSFVHLFSIRGGISVNYISALDPTLEFFGHNPIWNLPFLLWALWILYYQTDNLHFNTEILYYNNHVS